MALQSMFLGLLANSKLLLLGNTTFLTAICLHINNVHKYKLLRKNVHLLMYTCVSTKLLFLIKYWDKMEILGLVSNAFWVEFNNLGHSSQIFFFIILYFEKFFHILKN